MIVPDPSYFPPFLVFSWWKCTLFFHLNNFPLYTIRSISTEAQFNLQHSIEIKNLYKHQHLTTLNTNISIKCDSYQFPVNVDYVKLSNNNRNNDAEKTNTKSIREQKEMRKWNRTVPINSFTLYGFLLFLLHIFILRFLYCLTFFRRSEWRESIWCSERRKDADNDRFNGKYNSQSYGYVIHI